MNWKFWTWKTDLETTVDETLDILDDQHAKLKIARRALARTKERGLTDEEMAEAFTHLLENKGFEAILQLLTSEELEAVDNMVASGTPFEQMKHHAGAVSALSNLHARLIELEEQAKEMERKKVA